MSDDFFAELDDVEGGQKKKGYTPRFEDPIEAARFNFKKNGGAAIEAIEGGTGTLNKKGNPSGQWFEMMPDGRVKVVLKNGIATLEIKGKTYFMLPNAEEACKFIAKAVKSAEQGGFDEFFKATARKMKPKDDKAAPSAIDKYAPGAPAH